MKKKTLKIKLAQGDPIEVVWRDATSNNSIWLPITEAIKANEEMKCDMNAIGYYISKTESYLSIAMVWDQQDNEYCGKILHIPTSEIQAVKRVR